MRIAGLFFQSLSEEWKNHGRPFFIVNLSTLTVTWISRVLSNVLWHCTGAECMQVTSGVSEEFTQDLLSKVARYRYRVFIKQLGWQLKTNEEEELDQYDRPDTVYVIARDRGDQISGCARLLPTVRPYLLGEVFPQLLNGLPPPCSPDVWELSRFAATDFDCEKTSALGQFSSPLAVELLRESITCAAAHGAKRLITVSPVGIERLLRKEGFQSHRAGPPVVVDGTPLFACWIDCPVGGAQ